MRRKYCLCRLARHQKNPPVFSPRIRDSDLLLQKDCVGKFISGGSIAGCSLVDYACVCKNNDFIGQIACCIAPVCDDQGKQATLDLAGKLCSAFGVDLPKKVECSTGASSQATPTKTSGAASSSTGSNVSAQSTTATSSGAGHSTTGGASSSNSGSSSAAGSTSKPNAAPTNAAAGILGAAAVLALAL